MYMYVYYWYMYVLLDTELLYTWHIYNLNKCVLRSLKKTNTASISIIPQRRTHIDAPDCTTPFTAIAMEESFGCSLNPTVLSLMDHYPTESGLILVNPPPNLFPQVKASVSMWKKFEKWPAACHKACMLTSHFGLRLEPNKRRASNYFFFLLGVIFFCFSLSW